MEDISPIILVYKCNNEANLRREVVVIGKGQVREYHQFKSACIKLYKAKSLGGIINLPLQPLVKLLYIFFL